MFERLQFYIRHSINDMRVNRQRTLFALLCIAAGVAAIVSMQTLAYIINNTLDESVQETNRGDLRLTPINGWSPYITENAPDDEDMGGGLSFTPAGIEFFQSWLDENYPGSELTYQQIMPGINGFILNIPERDTYKVPVFNFVVDAAKYPLYGRVETDDGQSLDDLLQEPTDMVLSQNLADDLEAQIGDKVRISGANEDFIVRGIVPTDSETGLSNELAIVGHLFGYYYLDFQSIEHFSDVDSDRYNVLYIKLADPSQVDDAEEAIERLRRNVFDIRTTTQIKEANDILTEVVDNMVVIMGLVSLLIGGIGIINTMMVIVSRRTSEVAVLKTIGLEPNEVVILFLVEAILMGIVGSLLGIVGGWGLTYVVKGVGETFLGQGLAFKIAPVPALNGFVVGIAITTIFGFLPTLAAGQIRPANVLRPSENVMPTAGRLVGIVALVGLILALSIVAQGLILDLLEDVGLGFDLDDLPGPLASLTDALGWGDELMLHHATAALGMVYGLVMVIPWIVKDYLGMRERRRGRSWILRVGLWLVMLVALPLAGGIFGYYVPALLILTVTAIITSYLYITLWLLIWAVSGGSGEGLRDIGRRLLLSPLAWPVFPLVLLWLIVRHRWPRAAIPVLFLIPIFWLILPALIAWVIVRDNWPGILFLLFPLFWPLIPILIVLMVPTWLLGRLIQNFAFIDFKIAMRSMASTRARGASTLMALVVGVFTLSLITMLVDSFISAIENIVEQGAGGNIFIANTGGISAIDDLSAVLAEQQTAGNVKGYTVVNTYDTQVIDYYDASTNAEMAAHNLNRVRWIFGTIDGRGIESNLPDLTFLDGRNLDPVLDSAPVEDGVWPAVVIHRGEEGGSSNYDLLGVGDRITFSVNGERDNPVTIQIVGIAQETGFTFSGSNTFIPLAAFDGYDTDQSIIFADVKESQIRPVRRALLDVPGTIVLETRIINDLINSIINQFTSLPVLVAILALTTGGIVIMNSVALSTLERRREIGIMKAVGLQRERVLGMLLLENGLMGIVGGLIGVGISFIGIVLVLRNLQLEDLNNAVPYETAFLLMGICILISLGAAIVTVWGASGEKPLNVLRYE